MDLTPMHKRVIALDVHQAKITACAVVEHPLSQTSCRFPDFHRSATHDPKRTFHRVPRTSPEQGQAARSA